MKYDYDLFVIGAGSGGVRASRIASQLGAKVAVAEDLYLGGTCVNVGCVPKKLFVYASEFSQAYRAAQGFGWSEVKPTFDWATLRDNKTHEIERLNGVYDNILTKAGVEVLHGRATIVDAHTINLTDTRDNSVKQFSAERILLATGGWPRKPGFPGAEHVMTSNDVFFLDNFPKRVLVQGGGYIAVEFAGIFNGLECDTELLYRGPLFLRGFDQQVRDFVAQELTSSGVTLSFNTDIEKIDKQEDGSLKVTLNTGEIREVDAVFSAIGRSPKVQGLGLENTQVAMKKSGHIEVNDNFQTAEPSIYALGDVVGRKELTPVALAEGMALANHLYSGKDIALDYNNIATAVFCQPNIGTVGYSEEEAAQAGLNCEIYSSEFKAMKNTLSGDPGRTLMKLVVDADSKKVVGAHMVGPDAGEIIQGFAVAIKAGATKEDFDNTVGVHPTAAEEFVTMRQVARVNPADDA
ncbi:MAG: glutathione-disulfide reductase [Alteromonadaceae bacterium]|nr:MAG: glutathione-disulfide reductase [Alteromonadaceae bacterium]